MSDESAERRLQMVKMAFRWGTLWLAIPAVSFTLWGFRVEISKTLSGMLAENEVVADSLAVPPDSIAEPDSLVSLHLSIEGKR